MSDPHIFEITEGYFGLAVVNTAATGFLDTWQTPEGDVGSGSTLTPLVAVLADYGVPASGWTCQVTQGQINARPSTTTVNRRATFCAPAATIPTPGESTFELVFRFYQDVDVANSLSLWLLDHDTEEAYFYLGFNADAPPTAVGRVRVAAGSIGGDPRTPLEATVTMQLTRKPLIEKVAA
jgi:hypothetical protein